MPLFDHFGLLAPFYERVIKVREPGRLFELFELPTQGSILDAGGGTGRIAQTLRGQASQVIVLDESRKMLIEASKKAGLLTALSASEQLPFASGTFARVLMVDALHHVTNQSQTAAELWRVLAPGGILIIEEPDIRKPAVMLIAFLEKLALMRSHFLSAVQIARLFKPPASIDILAEELNVWVRVRKPRLRV